MKKQDWADLKDSAAICLMYTIILTIVFTWMGVDALSALEGSVALLWCFLVVVVSYLKSVAR